ncbi:MAG: glycerophosphoryl diester phosphodiesterase [Thalassobaculum sp.]|uniref:glycerophosphoryl diester phosphodiesterase n=1 Tax=Thalassobaculum sp. TaxID=2022740 RepID=UPI0032ECB24E
MSASTGPSGFVAPRLIGHRGAAALAPENTLASIRAAAESGVTWIEVDAKLAQDGVPVLMHDDTLDRTTTATGPVAARTAAELGRIDAGARFDPRFAGETIPTLAQCLAECRRLGLGLDLEIKPDKGTEAATAAAVLAVLDAEGWTAADPIFVTSFAIPALRVIRDYAPTFHRGLLVWKFPEGWQDAARDLGAVSVISDHKSLETAAHVARIVDGGWIPMTYTVNDPARAAELYGWGVAGIVTDDPPALKGI